MDTKSKAEQVLDSTVDLYGWPDAEKIGMPIDLARKCVEVAQAYLDQCQEVERLKGETYEGKIELTARDCRHIREDALEEAAKGFKPDMVYLGEIVIEIIEAIKDKQ